MLSFLANSSNIIIECTVYAQVHGKRVVGVINDPDNRFLIDMINKIKVLEVQNNIVAHSLI